MKLDGSHCYRALKARDARFDGLFFVGVESTGIYCRPICPARTPAERRCTFFDHAAAAERAGFRACLRCRPELAPGRARVDALSRLVRDASGRIEAGYLDEHSVDDLALALGVSARHLRRAIEAELGVSPIELARTRRLAVAKRLLHDSELSCAEIAFAAGFSSVRRFNACVRERFGVPPSALRRRRPGSSAARVGLGAEGSLTLRLDYRPPLDWRALLEFLAGRAIPGVEQVEDGCYRRTVAAIPGDPATAGWLQLRHDPQPDRPRLHATLSLSLAKRPLQIVAALRALFDLDAQPQVIHEVLGRDRKLAQLLARHPGLRVPGAFDRFEIAVRAVLGQQVSVAAATTLAGRLAQRFGTPLEGAPAGLDRVFPDAATLAQVELGQLREIGLTGARAATLSALARALVHGQLALDGDPERAQAQLLALPGIGPWTTQYIAMRALRWPDALPAGDLVLRRALGVTTSRACEQAAQTWRPWRAYAVMQLWKHEAERA
ncbi:AlkA N-terminal domain-containing protein [Enhygromyxa salina]|uniref:DNA-3-methyladenine glycosylase II n=1 Tax=Enhygromyxa salina TaxID=215803 RepID=A0A2S9XKW3_9BACT|nr:AlkA N-terminal domain-containing protein [Enhygromyxa salina]PRP93493.1 DNA-3-methyladenine glycosylase 2 [Enhygromyxa salina]